MAKEKQYQPKDTGKLTNIDYGTKEDKRKQEVVTPEGTKEMKQP
ncbi:hypothetical protein [Alkalihalobacterium bogoriense]|nr:hypothetical protein [Alkalihalobacterium bogoriense]